MKKSSPFKTFLFAASVVSLLGFSPKSHALLIFDAGDVYGRATNDPSLGMLLCLATLPICLFDAEESANNRVNAQDLLDNGYSQSEAALIQADQSKVSEALRAKKLKLVVGDKESVSAIAQDLRAVYPSVSDTYVQFVFENAIR